MIENTGNFYKTCINCCEKFKCDVENCKYSCSRKSHLQEHIKLVHDKIKDFECDRCVLKCNSNSNLKRHIKAVHNKIKDFECDRCEFKCSLNSNLKRHIKQVHDKIKNFKCYKCDYTFSANTDLKRHIKQVHDKIKDVQCNLCKYTCSKNSDLQRHIKQVHDKIKDIKCDRCEFKCSTNGHLKQHIKQVHDKIKDFNCDRCDYTCSSNSSLQNHILICKGEDHSNMSGLELRTKESLSTLGFVENEDYIFNSSYSKLTDFCGRPLRPDFRFIHHKIMIECDGIQHNVPSSFGGYKEEAEDNLKKIQESDNIKNEFCEKYCYKMIRINYNEIKNVLEILHYKLLDIIDEVTE